jgi:hypothetical protein
MQTAIAPTTKEILRLILITAPCFSVSKTKLPELEMPDLAVSVKTLE